MDIEVRYRLSEGNHPYDVNDYMLGEKYNLPVIDIFNDNGTISRSCRNVWAWIVLMSGKQIAIDLKTPICWKKRRTITTR